MKRSEKLKVLFVCTGNTCRSPMAEGIAKSLFPRHEFLSAGIFAQENSPASKNAIIAMNNMGIDISSHKAKQLTKELVDKADYIIPMTENHYYTLLQIGIDKNKINPYGQSAKIYEHTANIIKNNITELFGDNFDS